jgi:hypothetical protein
MGVENTKRCAVLSYPYRRDNQTREIAHEHLASMYRDYKWKYILTAQLITYCLLSEREREDTILVLFSQSCLKFN